MRDGGDGARGPGVGRRRFLQEMIVGLGIAGHVHLTKVARAFGSGATNVHAMEKRLSRDQDSHHWSMQPDIDGLLAWSAETVGEDSLIVADQTDVAEYYVRSLLGLGPVRDASDPHRRTAPVRCSSRPTWGWGGGNCFPW